MKRLAALAFLLSITTRAVADDWPAWRGPTGQGYCAEKNLPTKWSVKENVKWKVPLANPANSTPIVWKDKIFLTMGTPDGGERSLYCLDRADGKQLWKKDVQFTGKEKNYQKYPYCSASPVTDGERVVVSFGSAGMFCYDLAGKELWKRTDLGTWQHQFGNAASPILYGDFCILWCGPTNGKTGNALLAVDKNTGKTVWKHDEKFGSWSTPLVVKVDGKDQLLLGSGPEARGKQDPVTNFLKGFDPKTGKELWVCHGSNNYVYTSPLFANGVAVQMCGYGGSALAVKLGGAGDITKQRLWLHPTNNQRVGTGIIVGAHVYVLDDNGTPRCYDLTSGTEVWKVQTRPGGTNWGSMVHADGKLYCLTRDGSTLVFNASPKYELLANNSLGRGETTNSSVVISNGEIFLRTFGHLWCISAKK